MIYDRMARKEEMFSYWGGTVTVTTQGLDTIPESTDYLMITEDRAVVASGGDLENDDRRANYFRRLVQSASIVKITPDRREGFKRISVIWEDFMYVITVSNHKVYVCKRLYYPQDPVIA